MRHNIITKITLIRLSIMRNILVESRNPRLQCNDKTQKKLDFTDVIVALEEKCHTLLGSIFQFV